MNGEFRQGLKFLVVDDSITMRRLIRNTLKKIGYPNMVEARDGRDAFAKLYVENPDFIITDWNMPNMCGLDFVRTIRKDEKYGKIPILMITTRGMKRDILEALKAKVDSYIIKPFSPDIVRDKIENILTKN